MLNRRELFQTLTAAAIALQLPAAEPNAPLFFTKDEFALLDTLTEMIVPADDHSPGAHEAGVAAYIDKTVAEAFDPKEKTSWRKGLAAVNELSASMNNKPFLKATKQQQLTTLTKIAAAEQNPKTEGERFFTQLKQTTAFVYYSSKIGIHQETEYKGNVLLEQFVGYDAD
jgi:hypothetical protein